MTKAGAIEENGVVISPAELNQVPNLWGQRSM
jgi:hypothetical protein